MDRTEWLKSLKPGDKVANKVYDRLDKEYRYSYRYYEVKTITPKGSIRLTNGVLLNSEGYYRESSRWDSYTYDIEPLTQEIIDYEEEKTYIPV